MHRNKSFFVVIFIFFIMITPAAYADVTSFSLKADSYTKDQKFTFVGMESDGAKSIFVIIRDPSGKYVGMISDPRSDPDGSFETIQRPVDDFFKRTGTYNATAFSEDQQETDGLFMFLNYDGTRVSVIPNFVLDLKKIGNKSINEKEVLSFTATVTDSSLKDLVFKLEQNPPSGATINNQTGVFSWTPSAIQGPASYVFDIVVKKGIVEDRETITVSVNEVTTPPPEPEPQDNVPDFIDPKKGAQYYLDRYNTESEYKKWFDSNFPDYTMQEAIELAIPGSFPDSEPEPQDNVPDFIDPKKGAQYYLDRYDNESGYKKWFDSNFPDYTMQEAIELAIPGSFPDSEPEPVKNIAPFVDPKQDPQYYIDRYNTESSYEEWFDENFPEQTIYEAVGLEEPKTGFCGKGTHFFDGVCVADRQGGCLIATAAYGSEMAPQVQMLREIRDNSILGTESGSTFMNSFNSIYYSFSPTVADWERESPIFKEAVRIGITPLLSSLSILSFVDIDSEQEVLGYGLGIIFLNLGMYFVVPLFAVIKIRKYLIKS